MTTHSIGGRSITGREWETLQQVLGHSTNAEVATALGISVRTVESHVSKLLAKFEVTDRRDLIQVVKAEMDDAPPTPVAPPTALLRMVDAGRFVGRTDEMGQLHREWAAVQTRASTRIALVVGDAGIGKSKLVAEFARQVSEQGSPLVFYGRCEEVGGGPFEAIGRAISPYVESCNPLALAEHLGDLTSELRRICPDSRVRFPSGLADEMPTDPNLTRMRMFGATAGVLRHAVQVAPLLLVIDDLHWASARTLQFLPYLVKSEFQGPMLVVCTYRPQAPSSAMIDFLGEMSRDIVPTQIHLDELHRSDVVELLESVPGLNVSRERLAQEIFSETRGNPLFVAELIRNIADSSAASSATSTHVPRGIKDVIAVRSRRLAQETQDLLRTAAVLGHEFNLALLQHVAQVDDQTLLAAVEEAVQANLLFDVTVAVPRAVERYAFCHAIVHRAILEGVSAVRRRRLHAAAARALEELYSDDLSEWADEIARHLVEAGQVTDRADAVRYLTMAGRSALGSSAVEEALGFFDQAIVFTESSDASERAELSYQRGIAQRALGQWAESVASLYKALDLYAEVDDAVAISRTCMAASQTIFWSFRTGEARDLALYGLGLIGDASGRERGRLLGALAFANAWDGDYEAGTQNIEEALELAERTGDTELKGHALAIRAMQLPAFLEHANAVAAGYEALQILRHSDDAWTYASLLGFMKYALVGLGRLDEATTIGVELNQVANRVGNYAAQQHYSRMKALIEFFRRGRIPDLERFARRDLEFCDTVGPGVREHSLSWLGLSKFLAGNWSEAKALYSAALDIEVEDTAMVGWSWSSLFEILAYLGDDNAAMELLDQHRHNLPTPGQPNTCGSWTAGLAAVEGLAILKRFDQAAELLPVVEGFLDKSAVVCIEYRGGRLVKRAVAVAAAAAGDWVRAESYFLAALADAESMPHVVEHAHTLRFFGQMLLTRGDEESTARGRRYLEAALTEYSHLEMPRHAALCRSGLSE
ncbi:AAA family ATPase [Mycobacterium sp. 141]|uniref:ATP-binding protein n=1 Tax=Mycobacterium sp. 141 TaxID=1120797 RepID=UPI0003A2C269|nr:AAA family ATPase [Mycobacterium sp. 141]